MIFKDALRIENPLSSQICQSLSSYLQIPPSDILIAANEDKYYEKMRPQETTRSIEEVFSIMKRLNRKGLASRQIGVTEHRHTPLVDALERIVEDMKEHLDAKPFQYIELGPEPIKTSYILHRLQKENPSLRRYVSVDINPASKSVMLNEIRKFLPEDHILFYHTLFQDLHKMDLQLEGSVNVLTMLGFEEGNEHPDHVRSMLEGVLQPGDLFLSEMQLLPRGEWSPIFQFYQSEEMRRFSKVTFHRAYPDVPSEYGVFLVPISLDDLEHVMVAVTAEKIIEHEELKDKIYITNYCIKYTYDDYINIREKTGKFKVISQRTTADQSVAFQLSERI